MCQSAFESIERSGNMEGKFLGVGLVNATAIAIFAMLVSIFLKTVFTLYEVEGLSEVVRSA